MDKFKELSPRTVALVIVAALLIVGSIVLTPRSHDDYEGLEVSEESDDSGSAAEGTDELSGGEQAALTAEDEPTSAEDAGESYTDGSVLLDTEEKHIAADPYFLTSDECDDRRCNFPYEPPDAAAAELTASCAEALFPYDAAYICSYNQATIDGEELEFYEYYDNEDYTLLCVLALDSEGGYFLYDIMDNSYTPVIVKA